MAEETVPRGAARFATTAGPRGTWYVVAVLTAGTVAAASVIWAVTGR